MVKSIKKPLSSRDAFIRKLRALEKKEPFTKSEREKYNFQQRNFIRGIQVARGLGKKEGIQEYKKIAGKKSKIKSVSREIRAKYDGREDYIPKVRVRKVINKTGQKVEKREYIYKGKTKTANKSLVERFVRDKDSPPSKRRYIDRLTGENISRRERDKRLSKSVAMV